MADHIDGHLYYECLGRSGPVIAFLHPNPMDQSCWLYQTAHFSTWYRCIGIDIPGYGRSPKSRDGLTMADMAQAAWETIESVFPGDRAILVGCSVGSTLIMRMAALKPEKAVALVMCGTGYVPEREYARHRIAKYRELGINYRYEYVLEDFSANFRSMPMSRFFAELFSERNRHADVPSIIRQFEAILSEPLDHYGDIRCPAIILNGTEDVATAGVDGLKSRIPACEASLIQGAGHASHMEQPWVFNRLMLDFLKRQRLHPAEL
jgi:pimeloyl-ACP methyl ester carboxylesterase